MRHAPPTAGELRISEGQLNAVAVNCKEELDASLRRTGTSAVATVSRDVLTVRFEHSLAAAEQQILRREAGRKIFQHYVEELAEQIFPEMRWHVERILRCRVNYVRANVDCDTGTIVFTLGLGQSSESYPA